MANVAIIGSEKSGRTSLVGKLGKKGTESDITLYNFVKGDRIYSFVDAIGYPSSFKRLYRRSIFRISHLSAFLQAALMRRWESASLLLTCWAITVSYTHLRAHETR